MNIKYKFYMIIDCNLLSLCRMTKKKPHISVYKSDKGESRI